MAIRNVLVATPSELVTLRLGDGQGGFAAPVTLYDFAGPWPSGWPAPQTFTPIDGFVASDLNGDGRVEVVLSISNVGASDSSLLIHMDPVLGGDPVLIDDSDMAASGPPAVGDVDGNGQLDVVWLDKTGSFPSTLVWFERTGGSWGVGDGIGPSTDRAALVADVYGLDGLANVSDGRRGALLAGPVVPLRGARLHGVQLPRRLQRATRPRFRPRRRPRPQRAGLPFGHLPGEL